MSYERDGHRPRLVITRCDQNGPVAVGREEKERSRLPAGTGAKAAPGVATGVSSKPPLISTDASLPRCVRELSNEAERAPDAGRSHYIAFERRQLTQSTDEGGDTVMAKKTAKKAATKKAGKKR
jgi:hypothetical protein